MPIASMLESSEPFVFTASSHSTEPTTHPSKSSGPNSARHSATNHTILPPSPTRLDSYQQLLNSGLCSTHYHDEQTSRQDVYKQHTTKDARQLNDVACISSSSSTMPTILSSRLPSPDIAVSEVLSSTKMSPQSLVSHSPQTLTTYFKAASYYSPINHGPPSSERHCVKTEGLDLNAPVHSKQHSTSAIFSPPLQETITGTTTALPPTIHNRNSTLIVTNSARLSKIGRIDNSESGYFGNSATENGMVKRCRELTQMIDKLDSDFSFNKERDITENLLLVQKVGEARNNTHRQYKENLVLLESMRLKAIEDARLFRNYQTQVTDDQLTLEIHHAEEEYLAEQQEVRGKLLAVLEEKQRKLKQIKDDCDLAYGMHLETQIRVNKRNLRKRGVDNGDGKLNKRKLVSVPALVFRLKDKEVYDDINAMRNGFPDPVEKLSINKRI